METTNGDALDTCTIEQIVDLLPHRYPFLLVDRIIEMKDDESCIGLKNVTINEPFFAGHFPGRPIMPGALVIEGMAQTAAALCMHAERKKTGASQKLVYFMSIDGARFRRPIMPGDQIAFHMRKLQNRRAVWRFQGHAKVEGALAAEARISAMMADKP